VIELEGVDHPIVVSGARMGMALAPMMALGPFVRTTRGRARQGHAKDQAACPRIS
jgi:hypothetical protein